MAGQPGPWSRHCFVLRSPARVLAYGHALLGHKLERGRWETWGRWAFGLHSLAVFTVIGVLFGIIYTHQYEYHYAWSHASRALPVRYILSAFWEGQEGSFLLWIFWHVVLGLFFWPVPVVDGKPVSWPFCVWPS